MSKLGLRECNIRHAQGRDGTGQQPSTRPGYFAEQGGGSGRADQSPQQIGHARGHRHGAPAHAQRRVPALGQDDVAGQPRDARERQPIEQDQSAGGMAWSSKQRESWRSNSDPSS